MSDSEIRYDLMVQDALKSVVESVLHDAAENGLPGEHHFYIAFDTRHPDVGLDAGLKERHPEEMTIVLQHQFDDLEVDENGFGVTLRFDRKPYRIEVPFTAIKGFFDPSVQFGLQFEVDLPDGEAEQIPMPTHAENESDDDDTPPDSSGGAGGGEVIALDQFRKK